MEKVKLGDACVFIRNGANIKNDKGKSGIPITRIETIANGVIDENSLGYANIYDERYEGYYLKQNDILMSHINSMKHLGKVAICSEDKKIIHGMNLLNIRLKENILAKYVYYFFKTNSFKKQLYKISKQSVNQSSFNVNDLKKISIDLPDLQTQNKIVNNMDKVQEIIDIKKRQITQLDELIKSQFVEMFENENRYVNLEDVCIFINGDRGKNYPSADKISKDSNGVPFINAGLLTNNGVDWENMNYISEETYNKLGSGKIQKDDILYCLRGSLGKHAIIDFDNKGAIASSLVILRADQSKIQPNFLLIQLGMDEIVRQQIQANNGSSQPNLSASSVKKYKIKLPDTESQSEFVNIVKQIDKQKFEIQKSLEETQKLQESLMNKYFNNEV